MRSFVSFILILISWVSFAAEKSKLPILKTKQSLNNIRFISNDGKYTYYQKSSGELLLSKNYKNYTVLKNDTNTEYFIYSSDSKKKLIIEVDSFFHTINSYNKLNKLYLVDYGKETTEEIGLGLAPKLHLNDQYYSSFNPKLKTLSYYKTNENKKVFTIRLANPLNPFFIPETSMLTMHDIVYTDINKEGQNAILSHSIIDKKTQTIYKSTLSGAKVEYCVMDKKLYVGEFSFGDIEGNSKILEIPLYNNPDFKNYKILYQSQQSDIGNMRCEGGDIYFIKTLTYNEKINLKTTEIAKYSTRDNKTSIISDLKYVTQIIVIDDMIVSPFRGNYYLIKGNANLNKDGIKKDKAIDKRDLKFQ
jgi:hypothetical protein